MAKQLINLSTEQFRKDAKALDVSIGGKDFGPAFPRQFNSGSLGWYANGKVIVMVGDQPYQAQVGLSITLVGSKPEARPNLNEVRASNGKPPIQLDSTGFAPAPVVSQTTKTKTKK